MLRSYSISIIMPAYNCERFLAATLDSLLSQTVTDWECVIVDDGSKDKTAEVAQGYVDRDPRFRLICQTNGGPSAARNHGFRECSSNSKYITFMDSDDVYLPEALHILRTELENHPECIGAHGLADYIDEHGQKVNPGEYADRGRQRLGFDGKRLVNWNLSQPTNFDVLVNGNVLFPPGLILTRKQFYQKAGAFDESFRGPEDWDMLIRLSRFGDFQFINHVILYYRRHSSNLGAAPGIAEQAWRVRCKAFFSAENSQEQRKGAKGGWRAYQIHVIGERATAAKQAVKSRHYVQAINQIARVPVHLYRCLRGYPTPVMR